MSVAPPFWLYATRMARPLQGATCRLAAVTLKPHTPSSQSNRATLSLEAAPAGSAAAIAAQASNPQRVRQTSKTSDLLRAVLYDEVIVRVGALCSDLVFSGFVGS